jgi:CTP-dependent riboflavin kinase
VRGFDQLLEGFMQAVRQDPVLSTSACCLYLVLLAEMKKQNAVGTVLIQRAEIQQYVKISRTTFQKSISELESRGYIKYTPSFNPILGSLVEFYGFSREVMQILIQNDEILFVTGS